MTLKNKQWKTHIIKRNLGHLSLSQAVFRFWAGFVIYYIFLNGYTYFLELFTPVYPIWWASRLIYFGIISKKLVRIYKISNVHLTWHLLLRIWTLLCLAGGCNFSQTVWKCLYLVSYQVSSSNVFHARMVY